MPPPQVPVALLAPQPEQLRLVIRVLSEQLSAHDPAVVAQPEEALHEGLQQPEPAQVVVVAEHVHPSHTSPSPLQKREQVAG